MVLRLDIVMRRLAWVGFGVFGGGGAVAVVVSLFSRSIPGVVFGLLSVGFAGLILLGLRRSAGSLVISAAGFSVPGVFEVRWTEVTRLRVRREKRRVGRWMHWWHYRLEWTGSGLDFLLEEGEYAYALGHLGGGSALYAALGRFAPAGVVEPAE
ncbi:hypothetical protein AVL48_06190 [Amycolatopsis regifaucium]|uniref:DUF5673 domain-containing protein n=1 Tax=Amycolatopsis regifaucium TaxID=546365 RepID=A0A154MBD5_9PSEU|nr:hypothetical protein AVL48_06190 [Amycolatopsis regifaucium]OKA06839.1 hypothetical protein ATP06_0220105 [Amycolatopsis regifaucium]